MTARTFVLTSFSEPSDYDAVTVDCREGVINLRLSPENIPTFVGPHCDAQFERLLNRLRFEHAAQVAERGR